MQMNECLDDMSRLENSKILNKDGIKLCLSFDNLITRSLTLVALIVPLIGGVNTNSYAQTRTPLSKHIGPMPSNCYVDYSSQEEGVVVCDDEGLTSTDLRRPVEGEESSGSVTSSSNVPVAEKVKATDAEGVKLGKDSNIRLFPTLSTDLSYSTNIYGTSSNSVSSFISSVNPNLRFVSKSDAVSLVSNVGGKYVKYFENSGLDNFNMNADLTAVAALKGNLIITPTISAKINHTQPDSSDFPDQVQDTIRSMTYATSLIVEKTFSRVSVGVTGSYMANNYRDVADVSGNVVDQDVRDNSVYGGSLRIGYELKKGIQIFGQGAYTKYDYKYLLGNVNQDYRSIVGSAGVNLNLTSILKGNVSLGYSNTKYDNTANSDDNSVVVRMALQYLVSPKATVNLKGSTNSASTSLAGASSKRVYVLGTSVDYELRNNINLSPGFDFQLTEYASLSRKDRVYTPYLSASYNVNRYLDLGANYKFTKVDSGDNTDDSKNHFVGVSVNLKY